MPDAQIITQFIRQKAAEHNFSQVKFTQPILDELTKNHYQQFVNQQLYGEMAWLNANLDKRYAPQLLLEHAKSMVFFAYNYTPMQSSLNFIDKPNQSIMASYALGTDYHDIIKAKLAIIARELTQKFGVAVRNFVDTAPILEKPLARQAGLGWQGKHTNLVSTQLGNYFFIASMMLDCETILDPIIKLGENNHCGSCHQCLDICPTNAFIAPYKLDPRRCISYLTIEHKTHIGREFRAKIGNRIYGCDDCLAICPWNKFAQSANEFTQNARHDWQSEDLGELVALDKKQFHEKYRKTPIKRIGRARFIRNVLIAIGNSKNPDFIAKILPLLHDESPLVRVALVWALQNILGYEAALGYKIADNDTAVANEWQPINP